MGNYTNEKKEYYLNIIKTISEHEDFGKRNPVDIGIDCGFTEEDMLDTIEMLRSIQQTEKEEKDREVYYFFLPRESENYGYIASVNINSWEVKIVKKIRIKEGDPDDFTMMFKASRIGRWQLRNNIFVWTWYNRRERSEKVAYWMNLDTGKKRRLLTDSNIGNILIRESDVWIITSDSIILLENDGTAYKKEGHFPTYDLPLEADDTTYFIGNYSISKFDSDMNLHEIWRSSGSEYRIGAVEHLNGKLTWYQYKENIHVFSDNDWSYRTYTEGQASYSTDSTGFYASRVNGSDITVGKFTKNYRLLQNEIWSMDNKHKICRFNRKLDSDSNYGQVISIPQKDIFIGVGEKNKIIKIDLRNERQAVELPVEFTKDVDEIIYQ